MRKTSLTIAFIMTVIIAAAIGSANQSDNEHNQKLESTTSPQEFVALEINKPEANVEVRRSQDSLLITYKLDPWMLTGSVGKSSFTVQLSKIIPGAFRKFPDINIVTITATVAFSDIRGKSLGQRDFLRATFSRANAESIVWDRVRLSNLPQIADDFWQHPRLITDDSK